MPGFQDPSNKCLKVLWYNIFYVKFYDNAANYKCKDQALRKHDQITFTSN